jgi:hypothetical protein
MKRIKKALKFLVALYALVSAVGLTLLFVHAGVEKLTGKALSSRAHAIFEVIAASEQATSVPNATADVREEGSGDQSEVERLALDLRRELVRTAGNINSWESRLQDILSLDLQESLENLRMENERISKMNERWDRFRAGLVPLLNQMLASSVEWTLTEEQLEQLILGTEEGIEGTGVKTLDDILAALSKDDLGFQERSQIFHAMKAEVIAGLLFNTGAESGNALTEEQAIKFLNSLQKKNEEKKLERIFATLQEEKPALASRLMGRLLDGSQGL